MEHVLGPRCRLPLRREVEQVDKEVVRERRGAAREDAVFRSIGVRTEDAQPADEHRHLRRAQRQELGTIDEQRFGRQGVALAEVVTESVRARLEHGERLDVGLRLRSVGASRRERHRDVVSGLFCRSFDRRTPSEDDQIGHRHGLARTDERCPDAFERLEHSAQLRGIVDLPVVLRCEAKTCPVGPAALVAVAERRRRRPCRGHQLRDGQPGGEHRRLQDGNVVVVDQFVVEGGYRVLPDQLLAGDLGAEVANDRTHVAMRQLEPGSGEGIGELRRVLVESPRDRLVHRVHPQRHVGRGHHRRVRPRRIVRVGHGSLGLRVRWRPLLRACRATCQCPVVREQSIEVGVVPCRRGGGPCALDAAGRGVRALAGTEAVLPTEAHLLDRRALGFGTHERRVTGTVRLAEGVATGDECDGFLVIHGHASKRLPDVPSRCERVGDSVRTFRVYVDQTHLHGTEWVGEVSITGVALVAEPRGFRAPVDVLLGRPDILASAAEAECREAHRLQRHVAGKDHQVGP